MNIGLVGATNVGKSTLFNRLIGQFRAIVTDIAGTTVDILKHSTDVDGLGEVIFSDSPGLLNFDEERPFIQTIINNSDIILFVIDDDAGLTAKEQHIYSYIIDQGKKDNTILIINKLDKNRKTTEWDMAISDYYEFGFPTVIGISAQKQIGIEGLKKEIFSLAKKSKLERKEMIIEDDRVKLAIVGKPNAGKSTLTNHLVGETLSKIEDKAGTTRDYISGKFEYKNNKYEIFDTAGIKKKGRMRDIEKIAYKKTTNMLDYFKPTTIFIIDAIEGITHRDMSLIEEMNELGLPIIICLNKMDLLTKNQRNALEKKVQLFLSFAKYIPILSISAQKGEGIRELFSMIVSIQKELHKRVDTNKLVKAINTERIQRPPRFPKNKICKIFYVTQIETAPPTFMIFVNHKRRTNFAFKRRIDNSIRKHFGFVGTPIKIFFKERNEE